jgi:hypothetical protein
MTEVDFKIAAADGTTLFAAGPFDTLDKALLAAWPIYNNLQKADAAMTRASKKRQRVYRRNNGFHLSIKIKVKG